LFIPYFIELTTTLLFRKKI